MFMRLISNEIGKRVPFHYRSWNRVPDKYKDPIFPTLENFFDIDSFRGTNVWEDVRAGIKFSCARAYKEHKHDMKEHFDKVGGYDDVETAKKHPPDGTCAKRWHEVIDKLFITPAYRKQSISNKNNRENLPYTSSHGSSSYAQARHKEKKQGQKPQHIEGWRKMRYKEGPGWCTVRAEHDWEKIQEELRKMQDEAGESSVDEVECLKRALGERRGHIRGVGRKLRTESSFLQASTSKSQQQNATNVQVLALSEQFSQYLQQMQTHYDKELLANNPNYQPPPPMQFQFNPVQMNTSSEAMEESEGEENLSDDS